MRYCKKWICEEPENIVAAAAGVYAFINMKEFNDAEKLVNQFTFDKLECSDENDIMFTAASKLYEAAGKKKEKKQIDKAMKEYEERLEQYFSYADFDDEDMEFDLDFLDDDLPF